MFAQWREPFAEAIGRTTAEWISHVERARQPSSSRRRSSVAAWAGALPGDTSALS